MFEWDEDKRSATIEKHGIDFVDMVEIFAAPHLVLAARSETEPRCLAVGPLRGIFFTVVFTKRGEVTRIITARRARRDEREKYQAAVAGGDPSAEG